MGLGLGLKVSPTRLGRLTLQIYPCLFVWPWLVTQILCIQLLLRIYAALISKSGGLFWANGQVFALSLASHIFGIIFNITKSVILFHCNILIMLFQKSEEHKMRDKWKKKRVRRLKRKRRKMRERSKQINISSHPFGLLVGCSARKSTFDDGVVWCGVVKHVSSFLPSWMKFCIGYFVDDEKF